MTDGIRLFYRQGDGLLILASYKPEGLNVPIWSVGVKRYSHHKWMWQPAKYRGNDQWHDRLYVFGLMFLIGRTENKPEYRKVAK